ncbi:hypothetical protein H5T57_05460 [Candidatus Bipolaricaulota bacterium]|nr:hypothetical protein [Candidatus Bipolaricaulota bacterium]
MTGRALSEMWLFAWAMTASSGLDELARCYLTLYSVACCDKEKVEKSLIWLQNQATSPTLAEILQTQELKEEEDIQVVVCEVFEPLCQYVQFNPEAARKILKHWQRGEDLGHENYIRMLLEGGDGD